MQLIRRTTLAFALIGIASIALAEHDVVAPDARSEPAAVSARPPGEWELIRDEDGIQTYRMRRPDSPLLVFKGEGVIDAPVDRVLSVCLDADRATEWIGMVSESTVLRWVDDGRAYVQLTRFDLPWPVRDRAFVSQVELEVDPETWIATLAYRESAHAPEIDGAIVGSTEGTYFRLQPIDEGTRTHFTGIGIADPRGAIPVWLVNFAGRSIPHQSLSALRRQVRKEDIVVSPRVEEMYADFERRAETRLEPRERALPPPLTVIDGDDGAGDTLR